MEEFVVTDDSGRQIRQIIGVETLESAIHFDVKACGGGYNLDYDMAIPLITERIRNLDLEVIRFESANDPENRRIQIIWPVDFDTRGAEGFASEVRKRMAKVGSGAQGRLNIMVAVSNETSHKSVVEEVLGGLNIVQVVSPEQIEDDLEAMSDSESDDVVSGSEGRGRFYVGFSRERDPKLREKAIKIHGLHCFVCNFNFEENYGDWGKGYIEVHHLKQISDYDEEGEETDPATDLVPLCSNCHRMIHRKKKMMLSLDGLREYYNDGN